MTPFEKQLAETPLRSIPPEWESRLLHPRRRWTAALLPFLRGLLWPHPLAWGAVAACWVAILTLNFTGPRGPELYAVSPPGFKPTWGDPENPYCVWQLRKLYVLQEQRDQARREEFTFGGKL